MSAEGRSFGERTSANPAEDARVVVDRAAHDWRAVTYSRVGAVEQWSFRCARCGAYRHEKTVYAIVCVEDGAA